MSVPYEDPAAWGFCKYCAFEVAADPETGQLLVHQRRSGSWDFVRCYGSLLDGAPVPVPPEAEPVAWEVEINETIVKGSE